ncbi:SDR family NAD(P)-dependent oxidoreductase [Gaopeijia maritima]|uniref:SDR family NAD(P)-dependent oxidoreductase n=1 Tax=Gaopeijia maritima TaxID=3119007 RepID=UPI0032558ECC
MRPSLALLAAALITAAPAPASAQPDAPAPGQRVVLITGSTSGLGREVALALGAAGDHVIVHGRSEERGSAVVDSIRALGGSARFVRADFASLADITAMAEQIDSDYDRLDVLVNNAGIWLEGPRQLSDDGHELHFQVNYLATWLLTESLSVLLQRSAPARVVNVASIAQQPLDFDDVMLESGYSDGRAYAQSKLAQIMITRVHAEALEDSGVTVNALHPATMMDTNMVLSRGAQARASVDEGAEALLHLINAPNLGTGGYFNGMQPARPHDQAFDAEALARLVELSEEWTGR